MQSNIHNDEEEPLLTQDDIEEDDLYTIQSIVSEGGFVAIESGTCSFSGGVANLAVTAVGAGMLALPKAYSEVGLILGILVTLTVSFLTFISSSVIIRYCTRLRKSSYGALIHSEFGRTGSTILQVAIIIHVLGVMIVYLIIISDMLVGSPPIWSGLLPYVFDVHNGPWYLSRAFVSFVLVIVFVAPMLVSRDLSTVSRFSRFSVLMLLALAVTLLSLAVVAVAEKKSADVHLFPDVEEMMDSGVIGVISRMLTVLAVSALAFTLQFNIVPVQLSLVDNSIRCMMSVTKSAILLCASLYASIAIAGYTLFGSETNGDVLKNLTIRYVTTITGQRAAEILISFVVAANTGNLLVNFVLKVWASRDAVCELCLGHSSKELSHTAYYSLTAVLVLIAYSVSVVLPSVWFLVSLVGSTACVTFSYVFPGLLKCRRAESVVERLLGVGMVVLAAFMAVVAISNTLSGNAEM